MFPSLHSRSRLGQYWRWVACVFGGANFGLLADDSPARFFFPVAWRMSFQQAYHWEGQAPSPFGDCAAEWHYQDSATVTAVLSNREVPESGWVKWTGDLAALTANLTFKEQYRMTCQGQTFVESTGSAGAMTGPPTLEIQFFPDGRPFRYVLQGGDFFGHAVHTTAGFPVTVEGPGATLALIQSTNFPVTGMVLAGTMDLEDAEGLLVAPPHDPAMGESPPAQIQWRLEPLLEDLEVIVEPEAYADWIPTGNLASPTQRGNFISVTARLQKKGGGVPIARATNFVFTLREVSTEPGVCLNAPLQDGAQTPDLRFEAELNRTQPQASYQVLEGSVEVTSRRPFEDGLLRAEVKVSSFDFGAYGELKVSAQVPGYDPIVGHRVDSTDNFTPLPKVDPHSHIARAWLDQNGGAGLHPDDATDGDSFPAGDGHDGDGLSLYEEYRGFSIQGEHQRTRGAVKDLFIRCEIGGPGARSALRDFQRASHLAVHLLDRDEMDADRAINFRSGWAHQSFVQHGVRIAASAQNKGKSVAVNRKNYSGNSTPGTKEMVRIDRIQQPLAPKGSTGAGPGFSIVSLATGSIAHEVAHCCSVWHHGESDLDGEELGLRWIQDRDGSYLETRRSGAGISQTPIVIWNHDRTPPGDLNFKTNGISDIPFRDIPWLATPHGQHSGDISCFMCYPIARYFRRDNGPDRFMAPAWPGSRVGFCTSAKGTGVNAAGTPGGPWLGDACAGDGTQARGNCAGQFCVNDRYAKDAKHDRKNGCPTP